MAKTEEEIYEYVFNYKSNMLDKANEDMQRFYDRANDVGMKLNSDTMLISSGLITVIGGVISTGNLKLDSIDKALVSAAIVSLFVAITSGLVAYYNANKFWGKWAVHKHKVGRKVRRDASRTVEELEPFLKKILRLDKKMPKKANTVTEKVLLLSFGMGILSLAIEAIKISVS